LAYALGVLAPERGLRVTNYGAWLAEHPPTAEARLKPGPGGEGTAWSCAHGVGRWVRDCGCTTGTLGFHQAWRDPLRRALDFVRDRAAELFERRGGELFGDPWAARDEYARAIAVGPADAAHLLDERLIPPGERLAALRLLELQRHTLLM